MVLYLRHIDQVIRVRTSSTRECDGQFTQAKGLRSRGPELAHRTVWHFTTASLPLLSAGPNCPRAFDSSRSQKGLYRKDIHFVDPKSTPASPAGRRHDQPMGGRCAAALLESASRSWLSARASAKISAGHARLIFCLVSVFAVPTVNAIVAPLTRVPAQGELKMQ